MPIENIFPPSMPVPRGHYSPALVHNGTVYVSGQLPLNEKGEPQLGEIEIQVRQCMKNIETILIASGSNLQHVLKMNVFLTDISLWPRFNKVYAELMGDHKPARIVVPCGKLNYGCAVEIDCIAARNEN